MNKNKANGYKNLLVVFLVAIILIFAIGIVSDGWQDGTEIPNDNNGNTEQENNGQADENTNQNGNSPESEPEEPEIYIPEYVNLLTGLETSKELYEKRHTAFIFDSTSPLYGISYSDLLIEVPVENDKTRFVSFINKYKDLGKIGSLTATRDYISKIADFFGSTVLSLGKDSREKNPTAGSLSEFDLSSYKAHYYTEYNSFSYTNGTLLEGAYTTSGFSQNASSNLVLPYNFAEFDKNAIDSDKKASSVFLPFSEHFFSELQYNESNGRYTFLKGGSVKCDLLNSEVCYFDNCIVLFSDSVTYEDEFGIQLELEIKNGGKGYYFTSGSYVEISYVINENGDLCLYSPEGAKLVINRGTTYIGILKSSMLEIFKNSLL